MATSGLAHADDVRNALSGNWIAWGPEGDIAAKSQISTITFRFQGIDGCDRNTATWETVVDGKRTVRTGTFTVEKSANLFFPSTTTWCVKIHGIIPDYPADAVIHLVNVRIGLDNRLPDTEVVLKCRDAFYTEFIFLRPRRRGHIHSEKGDEENTHEEPTSRRKASARAADPIPLPPVTLRVLGVCRIALPPL